MSILHYLLYAVLIAFVYNSTPVPKVAWRRHLFSIYLATIFGAYGAGFYFEQWRLTILIYMSFPVYMYTIYSIEAFFKATLQDIPRDSTKVSGNSKKKIGF